MHTLILLFFIYLYELNLYLILIYCMDVVEYTIHLRYFESFKRVLLHSFRNLIFSEFTASAVNRHDKTTSAHIPTKMNFSILRKSLQIYTRFRVFILSLAFISFLCADDDDYSLRPWCKFEWVFWSIKVFTDIMCSKHSRCGYLTFTNFEI